MMFRRMIGHFERSIVYHDELTNVLQISIVWIQKTPLIVKLGIPAFDQENLVNQIREFRLVDRKVADFTKYLEFAGAINVLP